MDTFDFLIIIIGFLIVGIIFLIKLLINNNKEREEEYQEYAAYKGEIQQEKEDKNEVATRRRITPKMKKYILERDNYTCQICGISKGFLDNLIPGLGDFLLLEIAHVESVANGGTGKDEDNLQCLCWRCNRKCGGKKTNREVADAIDYGIVYLLQKDGQDT